MARVLLAAVLAVTAGSSGPLRFTWSNGSGLAMGGKTYVWCGKWDDGANVRTLRIQQGSPFAPPWWTAEVRLSLARRGRAVRFPALVGKTASMFVSQPRKQLEASADSERSRGSLTVLDDVSCTPGSRVRVRIDATLAGEETGTPPVAVHGTFTGTVGTKAAPGVSP